MYTNDPNNEKDTLDRILWWIFHVGVFLFIAWVIVQFMQYFRII